MGKAEVVLRVMARVVVVGTKAVVGGVVVKVSKTLHRARERFFMVIQLYGGST